MSTRFRSPGKIMFLDPMELKQLERQFERQRYRAKLNSEVHLQDRATPSIQGEICVSHKTLKHTQSVKQMRHTGFK